MSLRSYLTHRVTIQRMASASGVTRAYQDVATNVHCLIQPLSAEAAESVGSSFSTDFRAWFALDTDLRENDRLVDHEGRVFGVRGIKARNYGPVHTRHLEVLLGRDRSQT